MNCYQSTALRGEHLFMALSGTSWEALVSVLLFYLIFLCWPYLSNYTNLFIYFLKRESMHELGKEAGEERERV